VSAFQVLQPARDIAVDAFGDAACNCDPELTRRVIENLVGNAMKHTSIDGLVRVVISSAPHGVSLRIHDEGPGVPPERRTQIFEAYSADGPLSATGYESSGLGLAFCRLAVEAQGGTIHVESGARRGSVFIVELPR
jgi:signal transduction histidine kinase